MVTSQRGASAVRRDAWVEIDLGAIEHNVRIIKDWLVPSAAEKPQLPGKIPEIMAVVKSDAYGHGALAVAEVALAAGVTALAVASVDEGCQLRTALADVPILILSPTPFWAINTALEYDLDLTITARAEIEAAAETARKMNKIARVHLKVDTGMHRLGCMPESVPGMVEQVRAYQSCSWSASSAIWPEPITTRQQRSKIWFSKSDCGSAYGPYE